MSSSNAVRLARNSRMMRKFFGRMVRTTYPSGTSLVALSAQETGRYRFKHSLRYTCTLRTPAGERVSIAVRGNMPSIDTRAEMDVADTVQRKLSRHGFAFGEYRSPASFGTVPSLGINLYEEVPGVTLERLIRRRAPRAVPTIAHAGAWLAKLHNEKLSVGPRRTAGLIERDAGFFRDDARRYAPEVTEPMVRLTYAASRALCDNVTTMRAYERTAHGDLNLGNIIAAPHRVSFIDFGNSVRVDPLTDLGNALAQLDLLVWKGHCSAPRRNRLARALLRAYRSHIHGIGPAFTRRIDLHRAWWTLQVLSYTLSTDRDTGVRIAPAAYATAERLLSNNGYAPAPALVRADRAAIRRTLIDEASMHAYFQERIDRFFPGAQKIERVAVRHQPALSTTSYLTRYRLTITMPDGTIIEKTVRGNFVDRATFNVMVRVYGARSARLSSMRPLAYEGTIGYEFYEELDGTPLRMVRPSSAHFSILMAPIGHALAHLHTVRTTGITSLGLHRERDQVIHNRNRIVRAEPSLRAVADAAARAVIGIERLVWTKRRAIVHNDFQASNVIVTGPSRVGVIDFTLSGVAHPAIDVGNFLAHLSVMLHGIVSPAVIERRRHAFLTAYLSHYRGHARTNMLTTIPLFELRSALDILAITLINLGPRDPNRRRYVTLLRDTIQRHLSTLLTI